MNISAHLSSSNNIQKYIPNSYISEANFGVK